MKKSIILVACILAFSVIYAQQATDFLKKGTKLRYYLHNSGDDYEFIVDITSMGEEIDFFWWMTRPASNEGSVTMTKFALEHATKQQNYFRGGHDDLTHVTTVWVSKDVYQALKNKSSIGIEPEYLGEILTYVRDIEYEVVIDGQKVKVNTLYAEGSLGDKFWILDNPDNPIILKMVISFNIEIGEIMTQGYWED